MTYEGGDGMKIVRPDFIFFAKQSDGAIVADIVDRHGIHLADALPKLKGLAKYAEANLSTYRRIEAVAKIDVNYRAPQLMRLPGLDREGVCAVLLAIGGVFTGLFVRFKNIGRDCDDSVFAVVPVPMNGCTGFPGSIARMKSLRCAVVTDDRVCPLHEINHGGPILVAMETNMPARFDREQSQPQLPASHCFKFGAQIDNGGLAGGVSLVVFRSIFWMR